MDIVSDKIFEILNGEVDCNSSLTSTLFFKIASSIGGICDSMDNIGSAEFTDSGVWLSPPNEICWAIAFGYGGSGGGGGGAPRNFSAGATAGDKGGDGLPGQDSTFSGTRVGIGGAGGAGGELGGDAHANHQLCDKGEVRPVTTSSFSTGVGAFWSPKAYEQFKFGASFGYGGECGSFEMRVFKDLSPNTGYDVIIGGGGSGGNNHPILASQPDPNLTFRSATAGSNGLMKIIYSGY